MLPDSPGAEQSALRLSKSILRMLWDLTDGIAKFWSSWVLCAALQESLREAETAAHHSGRLGAVFLQHISGMYFSPWEPPGVSERMWSVNLEGLMSGEYQTLEGDSSRPSEWLGTLMTGTGAPWELFEQFGSTWDCHPTNVGIPNWLWKLLGSYGYSFEGLQALSKILQMYMSNMNTLHVWCIDYCSLSTSKSYYSTQHLIIIQLFASLH